MSICNCPLFLFIYASAAVFVIVGGQPTTGDDYDQMDLTYTVARLEIELAKLTAKNARVEAELAKAVDKIAKLQAGQSPAGTDNRKFLWIKRDLQ